MRNKVIVISIIFISIICLLIFLIYPKFRTLTQIKSSYMDKQIFMSLEEAKKRWGRMSFNAAKFKNGNAKVRSTMVVDIINKKYFIGKRLSYVTRQLGKHDGHFWNDYIPSYIIEEGWDKDTDTWQIVFLPDSHLKVEDKRIAEVRIHKNCCY